jgi:hypothetical protein
MLSGSPRDRKTSRLHGTLAAEAEQAPWTVDLLISLPAPGWPPKRARIKVRSGRNLGTVRGPFQFEPQPGDRAFIVVGRIKDVIRLCIKVMHRSDVIFLMRLRSMLVRVDYDGCSFGRVWVR